MVIKAQYHRALHRVMDSLGVQGLSASPVSEISAAAQLSTVLQYTEWHMGYRSREEHLPDQFVNRHYRYERYRELLSRRPASARRQANIDLGCGAGVFSWAFLDWAHQRQVGYDRVDLYGFDHCRAMITLAGMLRDEIAQAVPDYPGLHYFSDEASLLHQLAHIGQQNTDYTITFGHLLVQAHSDDNILIYTNIISRVLALLRAPANCALIAADAQNYQFGIGWNKLLNSLMESGIKCEQGLVAPTAINDNNRAKFAWLSRES